MNWNLPGNGNQGDSSESVNQASSERASDPLTPVRESIQLCVETGKYSLELEELELNGPQSDGILFQRIRERYEHTRPSILPMRLRFSKPERAILVKVSLALG